VLRPAKQNSANIILRYHYGKGKRLRYATGLKIQNAANWNPKTQRVRNVTDEIHKTTINNRLSKIQSFVDNLYLRLSQDPNSNINNQVLIAELNLLLKGREKSAHQGQDRENKYLEFLPFFQWYMDHFKTHPLPTTKKPLSPATHKTYYNALNVFKKFNKYRYSLTYDRITLDFYDDFLNYMYECNYSSNYIGTQIKILKTIMNLAYEKDFHKNLDFKKRYFVKPSESVNNIYLTQEELLRIYNVDLSVSEPIKLPNGNYMGPLKLDQVRDLFLIGANTGLRISDFNKLTKEHIISINGYQYIKIETTKTGADLTIPVNPMIKAILKKRDGHPPSKMADQNINYGIKVICQLADIDSEETKIITKGGIKKYLNKKKFELVSSHTARRSFCTNAYKSGMPTIDIMAISGHKTEKVFYNYIKVNDIERAEKIRQHDFFNDNNLKII